MAKTCQICGKESGMYPLCEKHRLMIEENKVIKCPSCGMWHLAGMDCTCDPKNKYKELPADGFDTCISCGATTKGYAFCKKCWQKYSEKELLNMLNDKCKQENENSLKSKILKILDGNIFRQERESSIPTNQTITTNQEKSNPQRDLSSDEIVINENNKSRCIACNKKTDGFLFCHSCYNKYKSKELLFKVTNGSTIELFNEDYIGIYTCKDGHIVKSKSEREIDDYLFDHNIIHAYEQDLSYGINEKEVIHPDFFLPNYLGQGKHVYIEHWGFDEHNIQYTKTKNFKMQIYRQLGVTLISISEKNDTKKLNAALERKLNKKFIEEGKIYE